MPFRVAPASAADIDALVSLMHDFYAESGFPLDRAWAAGAFRHLFSDSTLGCAWLAHADGQPIGYAVLTVRYTMEHAGLGGYVDDLYVRPAFRRRGVAHLLLDQLLAECRRRNCKSVQVEVGDRNVAALAAYARFGLKPARDGRILASVVLADDSG